MGVSVRIYVRGREHRVPITLLPRPGRFEEGIHISLSRRFSVVVDGVRVFMLRRESRCYTRGFRYQLRTRLDPIVNTMFRE